MSNNYSEYLEKNDKLYACYAAVQPTDYETYTPFEKENFCKAEKADVNSYLAAGKLTFAALIKQRLSSAQQ